MREKGRDTHTMRKDGGDAVSREWRCNGAIEWKTEMLMRWSGRTSEQPSEPASDLSRKQEGRKGQTDKI